MNPPSPQTFGYFLDHPDERAALVAQALQTDTDDAADDHE